MSPDWKESCAQDPMPQQAPPSSSGRPPPSLAAIQSSSLRTTRPNITPWLDGAGPPSQSCRSQRRRMVGDAGMAERRPASEMSSASNRNVGVVSVRADSSRPRMVHTVSMVATSARPSTRGSAVGGSDGGEYVLAVLQSKSCGVEVGLAGINLDTGRMTLTQMADSFWQAFARTLQYISLHHPKRILITDTQLTSAPSKRTEDAKLVQRIEDEFQLKCTAVLRIHWNADNGLDRVKRLCMENDDKSSVLMASADKYYALSAASALLSWVDVREGIEIQNKCLKVQYKPMKGHMFIDTETARNLELTRNNITMKDHNTLYSTLNSCITPMGKRDLRASLLQPRNERAHVENRLDAVAELIEAPETLRGVRENLKRIEDVDFDRLMTHLSHNQRSAVSPYLTQRRIAVLLQLRRVVLVLPEIAQCLKNGRAPIFRVVAQSLSDPVLQEIGRIIEARINDDETLGGTKGSKGETTKKAKLYAVRSNYNQLLDLARSTYQENVADIMDLRTQVYDEFGIPVTLEWNETGFRFVCFHEEVDEPLPRGFINIQKTKRTYKFTSHELLKRNARLLQTQQEVFLMSDEIVAELVQEVVQHISCVYACSDYVGLIDVLAGLAELSSSHAWVRPQFGNAIAIKNGRHPILDHAMPAGDYVPNDVYAADGPANFQIIQGPNMSGKSTYLRQIGLMVIMAMVGCFVPAEYASFKLHDALLTRLSNDDHMEKSLSTFAAEMATSAMILGVATKKSLVLIDECFTFFTTHFLELAQTLHMHPGVVTLHLQVQNNTHMQDNAEFGSTFHYKVVEGACKTDHYGLELAKLAALPEDVMRTASDVATTLSDIEKKDRNNNLANAVAVRRKAMMELRGKLLQVVETSKNDDPSVVDYLRKLKNDLGTRLTEAFAIEQHSAESVIAEAATIPEDQTNNA